MKSIWLWILLLLYNGLNCASQREACEEKVARDFGAFSCDSLTSAVFFAAPLSAENQRIFLSLPLANCAREIVAMQQCSKKSTLTPDW